MYLFSVISILAASLAASASFIPRGNSSFARDLKKRYSMVDYYGGANFLDGFDFFTGSDPTHGMVNYLSQADAEAAGLVYLQSDGAFVLAVDSTTTLGAGENRNSIRIQTKNTYNGGLFIADFWAMPTGCGTWPAWWSTASGDSWPAGGEIDIIEGVNNAAQNQISLHTLDQCYLDTTWAQVDGATGTVASTDCVSSGSNDQGCNFIDYNSASFGPGFESGPGGVYAHLWTDDGITVWFFPRSQVPQDVTDGDPDPTTWGAPVAAFGSAPCNMAENFYNHVLILDTTICGDWAGSTYSSSGCPGTCAEAVQDPSNFANAKWLINYIGVYQ